MTNTPSVLTNGEDKKTDLAEAMDRVDAAEAVEHTAQYIADMNKKTPDYYGLKSSAPTIKTEAEQIEAQIKAHRKAIADCDEALRITGTNLDLDIRQFEDDLAHAKQRRDAIISAANIEYKEKAARIDTAIATARSEAEAAMEGRKRLKAASEAALAQLVASKQLPGPSHKPGRTGPGRVKKEN